MEALLGDAPWVVLYMAALAAARRNPLVRPFSVSGPRTQPREITPRFLRIAEECRASEPIDLLERRPCLVIWGLGGVARGPRLGDPRAKGPVMRWRV